jgi:hypothetical protein
MKDSDEIKYGCKNLTCNSRRNEGTCLMGTGAGERQLKRAILFLVSFYQTRNEKFGIKN